jgi:ATP/maltotriose-dependent transcriptional regulator MalT
MQKNEPGFWALVRIGNLAMAQGEFDRAAKLMGAVDKLAREMDLIAGYVHPDDNALVRTQLGDEAFEKAWAEGKALSIDQAVTYALGEMLLSDEPHQSSNPQPLIEPLTDRELDVLRLMGLGLSNPQIAEQLVVANGTVKAHTNSIFGKLNVTNRVQAVNRARELHLL